MPLIETESGKLVAVNTETMEMHEVIIADDKQLTESERKEVLIKLFASLKK
ncbi:MAG: hypothetical protein Ta2A_19090 [Treponemataceae bacterium]|nr:MAG: hypothetical protein Ta2A_19090 [Treponemataceae bacterium]